MPTSPRLAALAGALLIAAAPGATENATMQDTDKSLQDAVTLARQFEATQEPEYLRQAGLALEGVDPAVAPEASARLRLRQDTLLHWLGLLRLSHRAQDPAFDPAQVPALGVTPPRTRDGVAYPPGVDPARIDDPRARAEYEKALEDNRRYSEHYRRQLTLRRVDERLMARTEAFLRDAYGFQPADREAARSLIMQAELPRPRQEALLAACHC